MPRNILRSSELSKPIGCYSYGVQVEGGKLIYLAGMVALDQQGNVVGKGDLKKQLAQCMVNVQAGLKAGGASLADVIKYIIFTTDVRTLVSTTQWRSEQYPDIFGKAPGDETAAPGTVVEIRRLGHPDLRVEVEVIAHVK